MLTRRMKLMVELILQNMKFYGRALLGVLIAVSIGLITPLVLGAIIDTVIDTRPLNAPQFLQNLFASMGGRDFFGANLWVLSLLLIALSIVRSASLFLKGRSNTQAANQASFTLRERLYGRLQRLSYAYHVRAETGDLIQRSTSDVETTFRFLSGQLIEIINSFLMVLIAMTVLYSRNATLTLISTVMVIPLFLVAFLFFKQVVKQFRKADEAEGKMSAVLQENLTGVRVVRAFGRQHFEAEKFDKASEDYRVKSNKVNFLLALYWSGSDMMTMLQTCAMLVFGTIMASRGEISIGTLTVFISYLGMILWPVRQLGRILSDAGKALVSLERIDEILRQPEETGVENGEKPNLSGDIVFDDVSFAYDGGRVVLDHLSFTAKAGETVAILGATGSGKSSLIALLQRLYEPQTGKIMIGGRDILSVDKSYLRSRVGLVLQEPFLYSKTIKENVGIALSHPTDDEIFEAARVAEADQFIRESEKGYETLVGERGVTLSGGQKQRIAIARTLLKDNQILIFDDSLSAVDTQTDAAIRESLKERRQGVTTFIISHRVSTLMEADRILVLEKGHITQQGTHEELLTQPGLYQRIHDIQSALEIDIEESA